VLQVRRLEQNTALNAKTEQFITAKICGNALKQGSRTNQCYVSAVHNCKNVRLRLKKLNNDRAVYYCKNIRLRECLVNSSRAEKVWLLGW